MCHSFAACEISGHFRHAASDCHVLCLLYQLWHSLLASWISDFACYAYLGQLDHCKHDSCRCNLDPGSFRERVGGKASKTWPSFTELTQMLHHSEHSGGSSGSSIHAGRRASSAWTAGQYCIWQCKNTIAGNNEWELMASFDLRQNSIGRSRAVVTLLFLAAKKLQCPSGCIKFAERTLQMWPACLCGLVDTSSLQLHMYIASHCH